MMRRRSVQVSKENQKTLFVHCFGHALNLARKDVRKRDKETLLKRDKETFNYFYGINILQLLLKSFKGVTKL